MAALCFVLVLGSLVPCLPEFSSGSQTVKEDPMAADSVYTASQSECPDQAAPPQPQLPCRSQAQGGAKFWVGITSFYVLFLQMENGGSKESMVCSVLVMELGLQGRPLILSLSRSG